MRNLRTKRGKLTIRLVVEALLQFNKIIYHHTVWMINIRVYRGRLPSINRFEFLVSKETVVLRQWEGSRQKFFGLSNELIKVELPP